MDGAPFEDPNFPDYSNQPLPSLNSTLLQNKNNQESINAHSIQMMLGLQQQQDVFSNMNTTLDYKGSPQKLDSSGMHHDLGPLFQQGSLESMSNAGSNGVKRKNEDIVLLQSQSLTLSEIPTTTTSGTTKKNDKKKTDNNGVKKKKTR